MQFTLTNHPAQADHPVNDGEKFFDKDGKPVPLFPDQRALRLDGKVVGYVSPATSHKGKVAIDGKVNLRFTIPSNRLLPYPEIMQEIHDLIRAELGAVVANYAGPPEMKKPEDEGLGLEGDDVIIGGDLDLLDGSEETFTPPKT